MILYAIRLFAGGRKIDKLYGMPSHQPPELTPGRKVRITQEITARHYSFAAPVEGTIVRIERRPTGSWFAHGEADKLWLDRVVLQKSDGEISTFSLDEHTSITLLED